MRKRKHSKNRQMEYKKRKSKKADRIIFVPYESDAFREATREFRKILSALTIGSAKAISDAIEERDKNLESFDLYDGGKAVLILTGYYSGSRGIVSSLSESMKYATIQIPTKIRTLFAYNLRKCDVQFLEIENAPQV